MKMKFEKETDLCAYFIKNVPDDWVVYTETAGFDMVLVRKEDGFQIGVEAKLKLNAKVINQVAEECSSYYACKAGPDCRAVLVPYDASSDLAGVCLRLGIEVIRVSHPDDTYSAYGRKFYPELPDNKDRWNTHPRWFEFFPAKRLKLPDYIPDTIAGDKCPITLTAWKIGAIKLSILLDKTGFLTRKDFKDLNVSISRWIQDGMSSWLYPSQTKGQWVRGRNLPDFSLQHPVNYNQISDDFDIWNPRNKTEDE